MGSIREVTAVQAASEIQDHSVILVSGNGEMMLPDGVLEAIEARFLATGSPKDLTLIYNVFPGGKVAGTGVERLSHPGLLKRVYAGSYYSLGANGLSDLISANEVEAYLLPYSALYGMLRAAAACQPGVLTKVGLGSFLDPRNGGGKLTARTTEDVLTVMEVSGEEYLFIPALKVDIAFVRATTADEDGNLSLDQEPNSMGVLLQSMAANASGGRVVVQVAQIAKSGSIPARQVVVPGIFVNDVVVVPDQMSRLPYNPAWTGQLRVPTVESAPTVVDHRTVISRRAVHELRPGQLVNVGMGLSASVPTIASDEGIADQVVFNVEHGPMGGVPNDRANFGPSVNMTSFLDSPAIFDMYASGRLDLTCLGLGEVDKEGSVNVSLINGRYNLGGFLDIVHAAKRIVFCGTFTAGGFATSVENGRLRITNEGATSKFVDTIKQKSFDGRRAVERGQSVLYVTERAVFSLEPDGLTLVEVAPGIDVQRDILEHMEFEPRIATSLRAMDPTIFQPQLMGMQQLHGFTERTPQ